MGFFILSFIISVLCGASILGLSFKDSYCPLSNILSISTVLLMQSVRDNKGQEPCVCPMTINVTAEPRRKIICNTKYFLLCGGSPGSANRMELFVH